LTILAFSALGSPRAARASGASDKAAAEALFQQAQALVGEKKFDEACKKFELSQQLDAGIGTLLYLADCYEQAGRFASSWATFKEAASAARIAGETDREQLARSLADALEPKLSRLAVNVDNANAIDGFELKRDGEVIPRGLWSVPVPVDPGSHHLEAHAPGRLAWSQDVKIQDPGAHDVVVPALEKDPNAAVVLAPGASAVPAGAPPPAAADNRSTSDGSTQRLVGYIAGGAGIVALGVGGVFALNAKSKDSDAGKHCGPDGFCDSQGVDLGNQAHSAANMATIFTIGGAIVAATGITLILTAPSGSGSETASGHGPVRLSVGMTPRGSLATVAGSF
jgi:serine/threonine-protein kinase